MKSPIFANTANAYINELNFGTWFKSDDQIECRFAGYKYIFHWLNDTMIVSIIDSLNGNRNLGCAYLDENEGIQIENFYHDIQP